MDPGFLFFIVVVLILFSIIFWRIFRYKDRKEWLIFKNKSESNPCFFAVHRVLGFTTSCYIKAKDLFGEIHDNSLYGPVD